MPGANLAKGRIVQLPLRSVIDSCNWSAISVESCTRYQNEGIPGQLGAIRIMRQFLCLIFKSPCKGEPWKGKHKQ